jgi:peptide/nickel transport system substrate-binding protein
MRLMPAETITILQSHVTIGDPHTATDNKERLTLQLAVVEPLVRVDQTGAYAPLLADRWQITADGCTWTFYLRPNVEFHDGAPLQAADVVASIARACDPNLGGELGTGGLYHRYLHDTTVVAVDAATVQLVTAAPMADLLDLLVEIPIVPRHTLDAMPQTLIGSGPYRLLESTADRVVMARFDRYWGGPPPFQTITWLKEADGQRRVARLLAGEVDLVSKVPLAQRRIVADDPRTTLRVAPDSVCVAFLCNAQRGVCTDRRVRQALNYALDRPRITVELMGDSATLLAGPLMGLHLGYDPAVAPYPYDPAQARRLLAEAGYAAGMTLVLDIPTRLPDEAPRLAALMAESYAAVGISTEIRPFDDRPAYADLVKHKQIDDACCFDSSPLSTFRTLREKFHSGVRGPWWQGYANPQVDALLDEAQHTMDRVTRRQIYRRAYRLLHEDAPWIFLYSPTLAWGVGPRLAGLTVSYDAVIHLG